MNGIKHLLFILFLFSLLNTFAQTQYQLNSTVNNQTFSTCNGFIIDSGGQGGIGYSNNEDVVITFCPSTPGDQISITFNTFALSMADDNPAPNVENVDYMYVYDGNSTAANTLGNYKNNELLGVVIQATPQNLTGCITLRFTSNTIGTGMFSASVSCSTPCDDPVAAAKILNGITNDSIRVCIGEDVAFQDNGSFAQQGFNLANFKWDFMDGTTALGQNVTHAFNVPGLYKVQLFVQDDNQDNECINNNLVDLQVLVGTKPSFNGFPNDTTLCIGESVVLTTIPNDYEVEWNGFPNSNAIDDGCLTDDQLGVAQNVDLLQTGFAAGTTITNINQIQSICIDLEHSYMGDLVITVFCPNGQNVILHQQGGGGTYLGVPVTQSNVDCNDPSTQGQPFTYCFTPTATNTWVDWVNAQGGWGLTLPAGDYEPIQPLSNLVGCPTNGVWTVSVVDNWAIDDGTLFAFSLNLDPSMYPTISTFEPQIGLGSDSSYWTTPAPFMTNLSADGDVLTLAPQNSGTYSYLYTVIDNFGCQYDTTFTLTVSPDPIVFAGIDTTICGGNAYQLHGTINGLGSSSNYIYNWTPVNFVDNPLILNPNIISVVNQEVLTLDVYPIGHPLCHTTDDVIVTFSAIPNAGHDSVLTVCNGLPPFDLFPYIGNADANGVWTDQNGNVVIMPFNPAIQTSGNYKYTVNNNGCYDFSVVNIQIISSTLTSTIVNNVSCNSANDGNIQLNGLNISNYSLNGAPAIATTMPLIINNLIPGNYTLDLTGPVGCFISTNFTITEPSPLQINSITNNVTVCPGTNVTITAIGSGGNSPYTYSWYENGVSIGNGQTMNVIPQLSSNQYCVIFSEQCGSPTDTLCMTINLTQEIIPSLLPDTINGCLPLTINFFNNTLLNSDIQTLEVDFGDGFVQIYSNSDLIFHKYEKLGVFTVKVKVTSIYGCIYDTTYTDLIETFSNPEASFMINPNPVSMFDPKVNLINSSSNDVVNFTWIMPQGNPPISHNENLYVKYPLEIIADYPVTLIVENENHCFDSVLFYVKVNNEVLLFVPNTFTPDGDQFNQTWKIYMNGVDVYGFNLKIFNRWGEIIWESMDLDASWDGTYNGKIVQAGTYTWTIEAGDIQTDERYSFKGHVNVLR
ncbi:MAG: gliding motility-associated C-terminal domain-containing protein [Flavobacteriia bacterium]|nr:gliding motility-associated C-terminal domain-containing protein [Flavobacteriia bacterium]